MARLRDGFATLIGFSLNGNVRLWEVTVKPPGLDAGGANDTTTMRNESYRTRQPKALKTVTAVTGSGAYDPVVYDDFKAMLGVNQEITVDMPDGSSVTFWGWLDKFEPQEHREGEQPTASFTIEPSNQDNSFVEQELTYAAP
jgi:hypothetical protein